MKYVFLDIDEVLVDFVGPALALHGTSEEIERKSRWWSSSTWSLDEVLGITREEFWRPVKEAGPKFWRTLPELPWIDEILHLVSISFQEAECYLVSSPSRDPSSYLGKIQWIRNRFGEGFHRYVLTEHKHLLAGPDRLLIDDRPKNINEFCANGGYGILFPFWGNENREHLNNPTAYLKRCISMLKKEEVDAQT